MLGASVQVLAALAASRKITVETARSDAPSQFIVHLGRIAPDVGTVERSVRRAGDSVKHPWRVSDPACHGASGGCERSAGSVAISPAGHILLDGLLAAAFGAALWRMARRRVSEIGRAHV